MKCTLSTCPVPLSGFHFLQFVSKYASGLKHESLINIQTRGVEIFKPNWKKHGTPSTVQTTVVLK